MFSDTYMVFIIPFKLGNGGVIAKYVVEVKNNHTHKRDFCLQEMHLLLHLSITVSILRFTITTRSVVAFKIMITLNSASSNDQCS